MERKAGFNSPSASTPMDTSVSSTISLKAIEKNEKNENKMEMPGKERDPVEWINWYVETRQQNSCLVNTLYADFELSLTETKRVGSLAIRLLNLCMYRIDDTPVLASKQITKPQEVATHRRFLLIDHTLKILRQLKKKNPNELIHGLIVYRLNAELLLNPLIDASYAHVMQGLCASKEKDQMFEHDVENKRLCFKI